MKEFITYHTYYNKMQSPIALCTIFTRAVKICAVENCICSRTCYIYIIQYIVKCNNIPMSRRRISPKSILTIPTMYTVQYYAAMELIQINIWWFAQNGYHLLFFQWLRTFLNQERMISQKNFQRFSFCHWAWSFGHQKLIRSDVFWYLTIRFYLEN